VKTSLTVANAKRQEPQNKQCSTIRVHQTKPNRNQELTAGASGSALLAASIDKGEGEAESTVEAMEAAAAGSMTWKEDE